MTESQRLCGAGGERRMGDEVKALEAMTIAGEGQDPAWHAESVERILRALETTKTGLDGNEAAARWAKYGANSIPSAPRTHPILRFLAQFNNVLIYFLLIAAVAAWSLDHVIDASVILFVVTINAIIGYIEEDKAEKALNAIREMIAPHAHALRDDRHVNIPVEDLVRGDIVFIEAGDRVPADLRLIHARGLLIDEAMLTGESVAAEKQESAVKRDAPLGDRSCMAYSGTLVAAGQGIGVVVETGTRTELGHISGMMESVEPITTPLLQQINQFARIFTWISIAASVAIFAFATLFRGYAWPDALIAVVALAVGVIPEGLPAVITITLAIGVQRMAARKAVIRRLPAVETLGATSVICSDKTGTLTRNEMTVRRMIVPGRIVFVSGSGYVPEGRISVDRGEDDIAAQEAVAPLVRAAVLCNDAHLRRADDGHWIVDGDPMEGALVALAMKLGIDADHERAEYLRSDEIPFDAQHRFMATRNKIHGGKCSIFVKGAPERLLSMCAIQVADNIERPLDHAYWNEHIARAASEGERVLAFAVKSCPLSEARLSFADLDAGLAFLGLVSFIDPPRDEVVNAISECRSAGIKVKMITGDLPATASAIARQLGLDDGPEVVTGAELDNVPDDQLVDLVERVNVFARTSPGHKLRIVRALQSSGAVIAMTGDGVNDAPALKQADVGIAMGQKGTEAAKQAAEMVLMDENFVSIVAAVHEGRTVYDNIRKVIAWTLPTNAGESLAVIAAILFGFVMPMTPAQILWINLITTVTLGLVLAFEPSEPDVMKRQPKRRNAPLLSRFLVWRICFVSLLFAVGTLGIFFHALDRGQSLELARTMVVNAIVVFEIFYLFNIRYLRRSSITLQGLFGTRSITIALMVVIAAQLAFTYAPFMHALFATTSIGISDGLLIIGTGLLLVIILEAEKAIVRHYRLFGGVEL